MNISDIKDLIKEFDKSSIAELSLTTEEVKLELKKGTTHSRPLVTNTEQAIIQTVNDEVQDTMPETIYEQRENTKATQNNLHEIKSPMVGTFYASASPEANSYVEIGDIVNKNSIVCIVEAMKLFNEIEAETSGEIVEVLVKNGQLVEYGQPLFRVKTI